MEELINVGEFLDAAAAKVDTAVWCYFEGGAEDEVTLRENVSAFRRWQLRPRLLVDVGEISLGTTLLGTPVSMPLGIAPFALQRLLDPEAELATTRAAAAAGALATVPTLTSFRHAELEVAAGGPRWLQLYVQLDHARTLEHLAEAREAGYRAVVLTVDLPLIGRRERDLRHGFAIPTEMPLHYGNLLDVDPTLTWSDLEWIRAAGGACEVYVDGGVRRGTDIVKALALGARAAFVGRPIAAGLAIGGEAGALRVLELLRAELELALGLLGCTSPDQVTRAHVQRASA